MDSQHSSKTLSKEDDGAARLIKNFLNGKSGFGIDIEIIFNTKTGYVMIEFLKCEHATVRPHNSHPSRYWYNWRKFASLWHIAKELKAQLYLVNYEESEPNVYGKFRIMKVDMNIEPTKSTVILTTDIHNNCDFNTAQEWYMELNNSVETI